MNQLMRQLREPNPAPIGKSGDLSSIVEIFNDLLLQDSLVFLVTLLDRIEDVKSDWRKIALQKISLTYYDFIIVVSDFANSKQATNQALEMANTENNKTRLAFIFFWYRYFPGAESPMIAVMANDRPRFTRIFLDYFVNGIRL
jgi:predicted glycosyltransferase